MAVLLRQGAEQPALDGENRPTSDDCESGPLTAELGVLRTGGRTADRCNRFRAKCSRDCANDDQWAQCAQWRKQRADTIWEKFGA